MKSRSIASGFVIGIASLLGVIAQGCSAETGAPEEGANVETTKEAIGIAGLTAPGYVALFPVSTTLVNGKMFVAGGYDNGVNNAAITTVKIFDGANPGTWSTPANASTTLPTAQGEASIVQLPGLSQWLIVGGQSKLAKSTATYLADTAIYDETNDKLIATGSMATGSSNMPVVPCGTSKVLAIGGRTASGSVSNKLEVFTPNATPANGTWAPLQDSGHSNVTLSTARTYHGAVALDSTHILVFGGEDSSGNALKSVELITVSTSCDSATITAKGDMPATISRFAYAKGPSTSQSVLVAGGVSGTAQTASYTYNNPTSDTWTTLGSLNAGAILPVLVSTGTNTFTIIGGTSAKIGSGSENSLDQVQNIDLSAMSPTWSAVGSTTQLTTKRVGFGAALVSGTIFVSHGASYVTGTPTFRNSVE